MKYLTQTILVSSTSLWLVGCATNGNPISNSVEGAILGGLVGSVIGAVACNKQNRAACMDIGAGTGAAIGYWVGNEVEKRKQQYATLEDRIAGETWKLAQQTNQIRGYNYNLAQRIGYNWQQISQLKSQRMLYDSQRTALQQRYQEVSQLASQAQNTLKGLDAELQVQQQLYNDSKQQMGQNSRYLQNWNNQIAQLQQARNQLNGNVTTLLNMTQTV